MGGRYTLCGALFHQNRSRKTSDLISRPKTKGRNYSFLSPRISILNYLQLTVLRQHHHHQTPSQPHQARATIDTEIEDKIIQGGFSTPDEGELFCTKCQIAARFFSLVVNIAILLQISHQQLRCTNANSAFLATWVVLGSNVQFKLKFPHQVKTRLVRSLIISMMSLHYKLISERNFASNLSLPKANSSTLGKDMQLNTLICRVGTN